MITLVVPSPHSSSCVRLNSIIFFAAGCATSISRNIAFPSFVRLFKKRFQSDQCTTKEEEKGAYSIPPIGSRIIFNIDLGPRHVRITSATVYTRPQKIKRDSINNCLLIQTLAAVMFEIWAFLPDCLSGVVSMSKLVSPLSGREKNQQVNTYS